MKFIDIPAIDSDGNEGKVPVNPNQIVMIIPLPLSTGMMSSDGKTPIVKPGTGILLANGLTLPTSLTKKAIRELLEDA